MDIPNYMIRHPNGSLFLRHCPALLWAVLILTFSSIPNFDPPDLNILLQDKVGHLLEYAVLGVLLHRSNEGGRRKGFRLFLWVVIPGLLFGGFDELHQLLIPGREACWGDWLADGLGVVLGAGLRGIWWNRHSLIQAGILLLTF